MNQQVVSIAHKGQKLRLSLNIRQSSSKWIVCLHGIQSNKDLFNGLFDQSFLDDYSLLAIDFVGFGDSDKPENFSYDLQGQADIVKQVLEKLEIDNIYLIGHSLGGMVGILFSKLIQNKIKGFINAEGNLVYSDCGLSKDVAEYNFEEFKKKYPEIKHKIKDSGELSSELRGVSLEKIPDFVFYKTSLSIVKLARSEKLLEVFKELPFERMFLFGDRNAQKAEIIPTDIKKVEVSNAGHFMLLDNPGECYKAIKNFLI